MIHFDFMEFPINEKKNIMEIHFKTIKILINHKKKNLFYFFLKKKRPKRMVEFPLAIFLQITCHIHSFCISTKSLTSMDKR